MNRHTLVMKPRYWLLAAVLASVAACELTLGPAAGSLTFLEGDAQVDTVGTALSTPLLVEVRDEAGAPLPGARVDWAVVEGEAEVTPASSWTDEAGRLTATVRLGTRAGAVRVEASVRGLAPVGVELTALADRAAVVAPAMDSVHLDALGDSLRVEAEVLDRYGNPVPDAELAWSSSDETVVGVGPDGVVRSVAPGRATVTIRSDTAATALPVAVVQAPTSVAITPAETRLIAIDATAALTATALDRNGYAIEGVSFDWSSGQPDVATVSGTGVVTAEAPGEAEILAAAGEVSATAMARVEQEVAQVVVQAPPDTLREAGDTLRLTAAARDANDYPIEDAAFTWSSNLTAAVTVDATGLATAGTGRGDAGITASAGGVSATATVSRIPFGVLVLTFDDAHRDVYTRVLPLLQEAGITANIALPTGWVGQTVAGSPRLTEAEIEDLHDAGWSIVPHTIDHPDLTTVTDTELDRQLRESRQWVLDRGFRGAGVFIVPFHKWFSREKDAVRALFDGARGYGIDHSRFGGMVDWPASDPLVLTSIPGDQYFATESGRQQMEEWWAEAISKGKFLGTFFHSIDEEEVAELEDVIQRLVRYRTRLRTYADLFE